MNRTRAFICLIALATPLGCASTHGTHDIESQIIGKWEYVKPGEGIRKYAGPLKSALKPYRSPHPDLLVFLDDGTFEATYSGEQLAKLRAKMGEPELTSPVSGKYNLAVDWAGVVWIRMLPGIPERRVSVTHKRLVLHDFGTEWTSERYRRR